MVADLGHGLDSLWFHSQNITFSKLRRIRIRTALGVAASGYACGCSSARDSIPSLRQWSLIRTTPT